MSAGRTSGRDSGFRDDRGAPLRLAPMSVLFGQLWGRTPPRVWLYWVPAIAFGLFVLWRAIVDPLPTSLRQMLISAAAVGLICGIAIAVQMRRRPPVGASSLAACLAAHGLCGACGYDLHTVAPEPDGCVVCPECGAAWHSDRFVLQDVDPRPSIPLAALAARGHSPAAPGSTDDRGVPMRRRWGWPPVWPLNDSPAHRELETFATTAMRRFHGRVLPIAALAWALVLLLIVRNSSPLDTLEIGISTVVTFLIAAIVCFAVSRIYRDRIMLREVRRMGLCPNCGRTLPAGSPPTFDGCTVCPGCRLAWRLSGPDGRAGRRAPSAGVDASGAAATASPPDRAGAAPSRRGS